MSKKDKKLEKKDEQTTELSEQELDNVAGGEGVDKPIGNTGVGLGNPGGTPDPPVGPVGQILNGLNATLAAAGVKSAG